MSKRRNHDAAFKARVRTWSQDEGRDRRGRRPNQVWRADITYPAMKRGFLYLIAIMDWRTRKMLAWRISNNYEAEFCVEALNEAIHRFAPPEIMNTDQLNPPRSHPLSGPTA